MLDEQNQRNEELYISELFSHKHDFYTALSLLHSQKKNNTQQLCSLSEKKKEICQDQRESRIHSGAKLKDVKTDSKDEKVSTAMQFVDLLL